MGFDEAKVNRFAAGSSEGGQFAAKDAGRDSAGQVGDAFGTQTGLDAEQLTRVAQCLDEDFEPYFDDEMGFGRRYADACQQMLATGDSAALRRQWEQEFADKRREAAIEAVDEACEDAGVDACDLSDEQRDQMVAHLMQQPSRGFAEQMRMTGAMVHTGEVQATGVAELEQLVASHGGIVDARMRQQMTQALSHHGGRAPARIEFPCTLSGLEDGFGKPCRVQAVLRVGSVEVDMGDTVLTPTPPLASDTANWTGTGARVHGMMRDEHGFPLGADFQTRTADDGTVVHEHRDPNRPSNMLRHTISPDGTQSWYSTDGDNRHDTVTVRPDGSRTVERVGGRDGITRIVAETRPDGSWHEQRRKANAGKTRHRTTSIHPDGTFSTSSWTGDDDTSVVRTSGDATHLLREQLVDGVVTGRAEMATRDDGAMVGTYASALTAGEPVRLRLVRRDPTLGEPHRPTAVLHATGARRLSLTFDRTGAETDAQLADKAILALERNKAMAAS